ncbi:MAG: hypothetical protein PHD37_12825, partial [Gallionellaceae bacterium]|nr:hypothetical protein [Gallionellaceae bacterium]
MPLYGTSATFLSGLGFSLVRLANADDADMRGSPLSQRRGWGDLPTSAQAPPLGKSPLYVSFPSNFFKLNMCRGGCGQFLGGVCRGIVHNHHDPQL